MNIKEKLLTFLPIIFCLFIVFYPVFFGFFVSPNDVYLNYDPFRYGSFKHTSLNPTLNDPSTAYWTKAYLFKTEPTSFFFNPYIASGMPGIMDLFSGILNPFVLIPLIFPIEAFFSVMLLLKILVSFFGMYLFLKTFNLNPLACSFGATIYSFFGQNVLWSFWPQTNISSLFPLFFYSLKIKNKGFKYLLFFLLFIFSSTGGYPPYLLIFFYFFFIYLISTETKIIFEKFKSLALPFLLSILVLLPFIYITYFDLKDLGRIEQRQKMVKTEKPVPLKSLLLFFSPYKYGMPQDFSLKESEGFYNFNFYIGFLGILTLPFGFLLIKEPRKRFFIISFVLLFILLYFNTPFRTLVLKLPFISYSSLSRISILLGFSMAAISSFGFNKILSFFKNKKILILIPILCSIELGFFACKFLSYQKWNKIKPKETPAISFLKENLKEKPFRVLGLYDSLWPNSSEYTKIPDIRSHFSSEEWYRNFLSIADPKVSFKMGTFLLFWDASAINSPMISSLFVKYIAEPPFINTIMNEVLSKTEFEKPEKFEELPKYGMKRLVYFKGVPYSIELFLKDVNSKVILNIYDEFSQNFIGRYEIKEFEGKYFALIYKPFKYSFSRVYLEVFSEKKLKIGIKEEDFCVNISYSPYFKVYEKDDLKIFENRAIDEPVILTFEARIGFPEREDFFHYFSYFSEEDFQEINKFLKENQRGLKTGKVTIIDFDLYKANFKINSNANSCLVLPYKYNKLWSTASLDGKKAKIYKVNGAMSSVLIPEGEHLLSFNYGKKFIPFIFISIFTFVISIVFFLLLI